MNGEGRVVVTWLLPAAQGQELLADFSEFLRRTTARIPSATSRDRFGSWLIGQAADRERAALEEPPLTGLDGRGWS